MSIIGGLGFLGNRQSGHAVASLPILLTSVHNATLSPICYTTIGEVSSTRPRPKSIILARIAYQLMNIVCGSSSSPCFCRLHGTGGSSTPVRPLRSLLHRAVGLTRAKACSGARLQASRPGSTCSRCPRLADARTARTTCSSSTRSLRGASRGPRRTVRVLMKFGVRARS
jgi:hypothetical protein